MSVKAFTSLLLLLPLALGACSVGESTSSPDAVTSPAASSPDKPALTETNAQPEGTPLVGSDGKTEIFLPDGWVEDNTLHDDAEIQAAKASDEMYILVLSENKADFQGLTLAKHSEITRGILTGNLTNPQVSEPTAVTSVGGNPAVQYEIRGTINNINVIYLHTTVETANSYHQLLAWTLPSNFEQNQPELQQIIQSFRELRQ
jgi:hypothetical protein